FEVGLERGSATISCSNNTPYRERIELKDSRGHVDYSYKRGGLLLGIVTKLQPNRENPLVRPMVDQLEAFGRAVRGTMDGSPLATTADGLAVMSTIEAIRRSAAMGGVSRQVSLTETDWIISGFMIVILQFDAVNLPIFHQLQEQGRLRSIVSLQARGHWYNLETPAATFEGATYFSLYSGTHAGDHCVYWPFMWS